MLISALILAGGSIYLNQNKNGASSDNKSRLTKVISAPKQALKNIIEKRIEKQNEISPTPEESQGSALLTKERLYTEIELKEMNEGQFVELLKDTQLRLPKISDIKKLPPGALHRTPTLVIEAGRNLGVIKEILRFHESYERVALPFYQECAKNEEGSTPVRALCLTNLIEIKKKNNDTINLKEYPNQLVELSKLVTDI